MFPCFLFFLCCFCFSCSCGEIIFHSRVEILPFFSFLSHLPFSFSLAFCTCSSLLSVAALQQCRSKDLRIIRPLQVGLAIHSFPFFFLRPVGFSFHLTLCAFLLLFLLLLFFQRSKSAGAKSSSSSARGRSGLPSTPLSYNQLLSAIAGNTVASSSSSSSATPSVFSFSSVSSSSMPLAAGSGGTEEKQAKKSVQEAEKSCLFVSHWPSHRHHRHQQHQSIFSFPSDSSSSMPFQSFCFALASLAPSFSFCSFSLFLATHHLPLRHPQRRRYFLCLLFLRVLPSCLWLQVSQSVLLLASLSPSFRFGSVALPFVVAHGRSSFSSTSTSASSSSVSFPSFFRLASCFTQSRAARRKLHSIRCFFSFLFVSFSFVLLSVSFHLFSLYRRSRCRESEPRQQKEQET